MSTVRMNLGDTPNRRVIFLKTKPGRNARARVPFRAFCYNRRGIQQVFHPLKCASVFTRGWWWPARGEAGNTGGSSLRARYRVDGMPNLVGRRTLAICHIPPVCGGYSFLQGNLHFPPQRLKSDTSSSLRGVPSGLEGS
jgi:hypothetical protein